ncbi:MAG: FhaA domain-containing protein [Bacillota bacterium]
MRLFSGLENSLEKYIEGFFKDKFSTDARVQPTDIAKKLARAMRVKRRVSISNVYVPNEYTVLLHAEDYKAIMPMAPLLAEELADYLIQKAAEKKFTLVSRPRIEFAQAEDAEPSDILIHSHFGLAEADEGGLKGMGEQPDLEEDNQDTRDYRPLSDTAPLPNLQQHCSATLLVEEGNDAGKEFPLADYRISLGRRDTCDIVLSDSSVSRRHAQFERIGGRFWLTDLNSTNGTYLNGLPVDRVELTTGDVITVGNTVLIFKEY